ncbi:MAG TPA: hypothetical protein VGK67_13275 [Myxococcales bacterium]
MPDKSATPVVGPQQLRQIAEFVLRVGAAGDLRSTLTVGSHLFSRLFHSSEAAFRSRDPSKRDPLNDLAAQEGMAEAKWSRTRLRNAIELALMAKAHGDLRAWPFLRASHYEEVLGLPAQRRRELLDRAQQERWSVRRLKQEVGTLKPRRRVVAKVLRKPDKALRHVRKAMSLVATLNAPGSALAEILVEAGIGAGEAAKLTAAVAKTLGLLGRYREDLEEIEKRSSARLQLLVGKLAAPR